MESNHAPNETLNEEAARWFLRMSSSNAASEDKRAFEAWLAQDDVHARAYARTERAMAIVDRCASSDAAHALRSEVLAETKHRFAIASPQIVGGAIAAMLMLVICIGVLIGATPWSEWRQIAEESPAVLYETAVGDRLAATLDDGSSITLNTNSKVSVAYTDGLRKVTLLRGQALFEVAKSPDRRFVVRAGDQRVTALGTAFDVRLGSADEVQVVLIEGRVVIDEFATADSAPDPQKRVELAAGEQLIAADGVARVAKAVDVTAATSWTEGRLIFRGRPLAEVVSEFNRYSVEQMVLADDEKLRDLPVSGVFRVKESGAFVGALAAMYGVQSETTRDGLLLSLGDE